jgi:uridine kinase
MYTILQDSSAFSSALYEIMRQINPGVEEMELYEFCYCLENLLPEAGWSSIELKTQAEIEKMVSERAFYDSIQIKPRLGKDIVLDEKIVQLTNMLLVGLVTGAYPPDWVRRLFYFDIRGFYFLGRTVYFTEKILEHFDGRPYRRFAQRQKDFEHCQDIGYKAFMQANAEVDGLFIDSVKKIVATRGVPILLAIAGPTAAGKTEIVERLRRAFEQDGRKTTSIEMDNFLTDREPREARGLFTQGKEALHFELFRQSLEDITQGKKISIPRYNFVNATSSHHLDGTLRPGCIPIEIEPADIIFIEGNFPFLIQEVVHLIGVKVVYLTDDAIRLKRKWKRDIDYRKKYEPTYFRNRYFKDQFIMAEIAYRPQMEVCDMCVDTTRAALWTTAEITEILNRARERR